MARKSRIHLPGGLYHVMLRGNDGQDIFHTDTDRHRFYLLLQEGTCRFGYRVHAFCLMSNHIHLALQVSEIPLSRGMQNLSFRYTRWLNWQKKKTGHLFQGRYKAVLVDGDNYLLELVRYIHLNPVRAGMVAAPEEYLWSGHRAYLGNEFFPWLTTEWMLGQFGRSVTKAQLAYRDFVLDGLNEERRPEFHGAGADSRLLGDDRFMDKCLSGTGEKLLRLPLESLVAEVCHAYGVSDESLKSRSQQRITSEARAVIGLLAVELGCATLSDVGKVVNRDIGSISSSVRRLTDRMQENPVIEKRVRALKTHIEETT